MKWKFWLKKKPLKPPYDVLTELALTFKKIQENNAKPLLIVVRGDAMAELNKKNEEFRQGVFGSEHYDGKTNTKELFGVPVVMSEGLKEVRTEVMAAFRDELKVYRGQLL